ncbi:MAG: hypothetical protein GY854_16880 [Deltaproteobacteria bacterium]|nr:hypothetical protein [Deltaproteobacteria bacterium]
MLRSRAILLAGCFSVLLAIPICCGGGKTSSKKPEGAICSVGDNRSCTCPSGAWGVQYCLSDGKDFGTCDCKRELSGVSDPVPPGPISATRVEN